MDHLSNHQLILVALLISFVTSLATGIVTVSLMSQAPQGVTQTISQVVERTIEKAVSQNAAIGTVQDGSVDRIVRASAVVLNSVVKIRAQGNEKIAALGLIMSNKGVILTDKSSLPDSPQLEAVFSNGQIVPVSIIQAQVTGSIAFLAPPFTVSILSIKPIPIITASSTMLGQDVFSLGVAGTGTPVLGQGIISSTVVTQNSTIPISTTVPLSRIIAGSPLFNYRGEIIGIHMTSLEREDYTSFYPIAPLKDVVPKI